MSASTTSRKSITGGARFLIFGLCILLSWRYLAWRFAATIPPLAPTLDSLYPWTFAALETVMMVGATISLLTLSRTIDRSEEANRYRAWLDGLPQPPRVDVPALEATRSGEWSLSRMARSRRSRGIYLTKTLAASRG